MIVFISLNLYNIKMSIKKTCKDCQLNWLHSTFGHGKISVLKRYQYCVVAHNLLLVINLNLLFTFTLIFAYLFQNFRLLGSEIKFAISLTLFLLFSSIGIQTKYDVRLKHRLSVSLFIINQQYKNCLFPITKQYKLPGQLLPHLSFKLWKSNLYSNLPSGVEPYTSYPPIGVLILLNMLRMTGYILALCNQGSYKFYFFTINFHLCALFNVQFLLLRDLIKICS